MVEGFRDGRFLQKKWGEYAPLLRPPIKIEMKEPMRVSQIREERLVNIHLTGEAEAHLQGTLWSLSCLAAGVPHSWLLASVPPHTVRKETRGCRCPPLALMPAESQVMAGGPSHAFPHG